GRRLGWRPLPRVGRRGQEPPRVAIGVGRTRGPREVQDGAPRPARGGAGAGGGAGAVPRLRSPAVALRRGRGGGRDGARLLGRRTRVRRRRGRPRAALTLATPARIMRAIFRARGAPTPGG